MLNWLIKKSKIYKELNLELIQCQTKALGKVDTKRRFAFLDKLNMIAFRGELEARDRGMALGGLDG